MTRERIVVTGVGVICANGIGQKAFWDNVVRGSSGIRSVHTVDMTNLSTDVAGEVTEFHPERYFSKREMRFMDRCGQMAVIAAREAAEHAHINVQQLDPYRIGVVLGTSLGGMVSGQMFHEQWIKRGIHKTHPRLLQLYTLHAPLDLISIDLGLKGPKSVISNACAAGTNAIGFATEFLISGKADVMFTGGVDPLSHLSFSGFNSLSALSPEACAPYSKSNGLNLGEGAAILVLERLSHAEARGATILAEVMGYGLSSDSYHQTAPDPGGSGAIRSMSTAVEMANISIHEISYINGHGTGTPTNDMIEPKAIRAFLKEHKDIPISSTKSMIGHTLGAAGAIEGVTCVLALQDGILPPTINFDEERRTYDLDFVPNHSRPAKLDIILSNSFGFGGNNASIIFGKYPRAGHGHAWQHKRVVISGIGALAAGANTTAEVFSRLREGQSQIQPIIEFDASPYGSLLAGMIRGLRYEKIINPGLLRKMDTISKQAVAAAKFALTDSGFKIDRHNCEQVGILFATGTGPVETVESFYRTVIEQGVKNANPRLFPNTVMNAAAGHVSLHFKIKGPTSTITAAGTSTISALFYAYSLIQRGVVDTILVVSSDECNEPMLAGFGRIPNFLSRDTLRPFDRSHSGTNIGAASTAFLIQSEEAARSCGARPYAELAGFGMTADTFRVARINEEGTEWQRSFELALLDAGIEPAQLGAVFAAANGLPLVDEVEARVLARVVGDRVPVTAPKSIFGETHGSAGGLNIIAGIAALHDGFISATANLREPQEYAALDYVYGAARPATPEHVLISSYSVTGSGNYHSLVLRRYQAA
ncbi:3-oxoacyl-[acyl-carrier-protein] synthase II [Thermosporothrix hazakensis]|jgi:3-oxoacyl-[acyl-carrier-protein] synthase II|uniref:3-oxoacyl-[acyl-carrier-protein] synthase II n=2 Tax=Thermosporothrix TaxID=768650 RepID=A0A326U0F8_THEHA|nr:beta-ketoacyl-[acyl-carrier-protein] synthase family protein [Thermosporothrix hazakensis]PZW22833.1 3-oxoacyl-[acyl-carrier-protein] synthase II [Thermosporothrix hazakensis]BBH91658.1 hypothetical protein KTC_64090 [Thermosporothrix sp. COM3]GCE49800.1 hypothetical protein KTH_46690 [Thermosporothrix hazakensis]